MLIVIDVQAFRPLDRHAVQNDGVRGAVHGVEHREVTLASPGRHGLKPDLYVAQLVGEQRLQQLHSTARFEFEPGDPTVRVRQRGSGERGARAAAAVPAAGSRIPLFRLALSTPHVTQSTARR